MTDTAVVRIQPDEDWLADKVGRHIAAHRDHIRAAVAEEIATAITQIIGGYPDNGATRPKAEWGGHLNDAEWAAHLARQIGAASA
ncbi:hypothetical protein [Microbispora rosea]|uniref:hypothetical protein n=1 Tax=Microbispora rosea TaxID=58117 RepID=UPI00378B4229